jgi:hypothetical protein
MTATSGGQPVGRAAESTRRPLTEGQRRTLAAKARSLRQQSQARWRVYMVSPIGIGVLWLLTILASDQPWQVVTVFWAVVGAGISAWVVFGLRRDMSETRASAEMCESAYRRNESDVVDVRSTAYISFGEYEDEGPCYAFALEQGGVLFLQGQQYYPSARFPSLDFSIVTPLDEHGRAVDEMIEKRGPTAAPIRIAPPAVKLDLNLPENMIVLDATLEDIEERLRAEPAD